MNNLVFCSDSVIGREIAYILGIQFVSVDLAELPDALGRTLCVVNSGEEEAAIAHGLDHTRDFVNIFDIGTYLDQNRNFRIPKRRTFPPVTDLERIRKISNDLLYPSEMLIKVLYSKPMDIDCRELTDKVFLDDDGNLWGCCPGWISRPHGNFLTDDDPYDNCYARILKLSQLNRTFCFCDLTKCRYYGRGEVESFEVDLSAPAHPKQITVSIDRSCNLRCNSCRKDFYVPTEEQQRKTGEIADKLLASGHLEQSHVFLAGQGEIFYSKCYSRILKEMKPAQSIMLLSNGTLFTRDKWEMVKSKFRKVHVAISIDAATKETYSLLRHGDFNRLLENLKMLGELRRSGELSGLWFNFVVQRENMHEMKAFVLLAESCSVDVVQFTKLNNWGTMTAEEYRDKCLIKDGILDYELYTILQDPVFRHKCVNLDMFKRLMKDTEKVYAGDPQQKE